MLRQVLSILFLGFYFLINAQPFTIKEKYLGSIDSKKGTWSIGLNGNNARNLNGFVSPPIVFYFPTFGIKSTYNPINRLALGVEYSHQPIWGTFVTSTQHAFYSGVLIRYDFWRRRNAFFIEANQRVSNINWYNYGFTKSFPVFYTGIGLGFRAKVYPNIYVIYSHLFQFNTSNKDASIIQDTRLGISSYFNRNEKDEPLKVANTRMDRTSKLLIGITGSYIHFDNSDFIGGYHWFENTLRAGFYQSHFLSIGVYGRFAIGKSQIPNKQSDLFYFTGPFLNIKFNAMKKWNFYAELAYLKSNFTLIEGGITNDLPQKGNATYYSTTTGIGYRINPNLALDFGMNMSNVIKSNTGGLYGAGGYRVGIEQTLKLKHRRIVRSF